MTHRIPATLFLLLASIVPILAAEPGTGADWATIRTRPLYESCTPSAGSPSLAAALKALKDGDAARRIKAIEQLLAQCSPEAVEPLIAALPDADVAVKVAAIEALGQLRDPQAIDPLVELAYHEDWRVRLALTRTLASYQVYRSNNALLNVIVNPGDKKVVTEEGDMRARCLGILQVNQLRDVRFSRKAIGFLFTFLDYQDPVLRRLAEEAATELKTTRNGYHELVAILKQHTFPDFRIKAATWLGKWKLAEAREALTEAAANDKHPAVKKAAAEALAGWLKN